MSRRALLSDDLKYRWVLRRDIDIDGPVAALCGVNPSIADAEIDDHTIRKDIGFARVHGWREFVKINKFAYRATDVRELAGAHDPIGKANNHHIRKVMQEVDVVVGCWGSLGKLPQHLRNRWQFIEKAAHEAGKKIMCFGTTKDGHPAHTLRLPYDTPLIEWEGPPL